VSGRKKLNPDGRPGRFIGFKAADDRHRAYDAARRAEGTSLSAWVREACEEKLARDLGGDNGEAA
jgi:hypothetical protein